MSRIRSLATRALLIGVGCCLASDPIAAASFVSGDYQFDYDLALGGGAGGSQCHSSTGSGGRECSISGSHAPNIFMPDNFQTYNESEYVASDIGSDSVEVSSSAQLTLSTLPETGLRTDQRLGFFLSDSNPTSFHTTANGDGAFASSVVVDTTTTLEGEETLELAIFLNVNIDSPPLAGVDWTFAYSVVDLDSSSSCETLGTCQTLATFYDDASANIDITGINGHRLAIQFSAEMSSSQPSGFAAGASNLSDRVFSSSIFARSDVRVLGTPVIPEPTTGALVALGLVLLGWRRGSAQT